MDERLPVYELILKNIRSGELPESFSLPSDPEEEGYLFADGAWDGICMYHMNRMVMGADEKKLMIKALNFASTADSRNAEITFTELGKKYRAIMAVDDIQEYIIKHAKKLPIGNVYRTAMEIILHASDKEAVKYALSILELIPLKDEAPKEIVRRIGLSDEFTIFAIWNMRKWENGNNEVFRLARKVHGWGRIHCVDKLEPATQEIRDWLFKEGIDNRVLSSYSAFPVWEKADVKNRLNKDMTYGDLKCVGKILAALTDEGPVVNISRVENAEQIILEYLTIAEDFRLSNVDYESICTIRDWAESEDGDDDGATGSRTLIAERCRDFLSSEECTEAVEEAVRNGESFSLARWLGIDFEEDLFRFMDQDFKNYYYLCSYLTANDEYFDKVAELFRDNLPLGSMRKDPSDNPGVGEAFANYNMLESFIRELRDHPAECDDLIIAGLWSPVIRTRNMSLAVIAEWTKILQQPISEISGLIYNELGDMHKKETQDNLKEIEQQLLDGIIPEESDEEDTGDE